MSMLTTTWFQNIVDDLTKIKGGIKPHVVIGDEDSVDLNQFQQGYIAGLERAISVIQQNMG